MKTTLFLLILVTACCIANAQYLAIAENKTQPTVPTKTDKPVSTKNPQFVFQNYGVDLNHNDLKEYPEHLLGDQIAKKSYAIQRIYVHRHPSTLGFSDSTIEIYKPAIYNAITKLDNYFKKVVRRGEMNASDASAELSKYLDMAYLAYYEEQTNDLEQALRKAKSPEQLLSVFNAISIKE